MFFSPSLSCLILNQRDELSALITQFFTFFFSTLYSFCETLHFFVALEAFFWIIWSLLSASLWRHIDILHSTYTFLSYQQSKRKWHILAAKIFLTSSFVCLFYTWEEREYTLNNFHFPLPMSFFLSCVTHLILNLSQRRGGKNVEKLKLFFCLNIFIHAMKIC